MLNPSSVEFLVLEALANIRRNRLMALAAVLTAGVSLAISAGFALTAIAVHRACEKLPQEFDMAVYVRRGTPPEQVSKLKQTLAALPGVASVTFISKERGWQEFKRSLGQDISMDDVLYNPALDSFKIRMSDPRMGRDLQNRIRNLPEVDDILWRQNEVRFFTGLARVVGIAGAVATVVLFLGSAFIIGNTIRLGIYARRREVSIMRLVGARPSFIRFPFLLEGMLLAGAGAVLALLLIRLAGAYLEALTGDLQSITRFLDSGVAPWQLAALLMAAGLGLGALSSYLSIRRYLKEGSLEAAAQ
ncbi:MAG: permease-like cell division protein FtsX [Armatimonadota bacterium]